MSASAAKRLAQRLARLVGRAQPGVEQQHGMAGRGGDLRDARAHGAGAEHGDHGIAGERAHDVARQRPAKRGGRLSTNAATPSR